MRIKKIGFNFNTYLREIITSKKLERKLLWFVRLYFDATKHRRLV